MENDFSDPIRRADDVGPNTRRVRLARSIRRENGDISRRFPDPFPVLPPLSFLRGLIAFLGWTRVFEFDFSFSLWLSRLGIYRRPTDTQTEESNGGNGGGIETGEEGEIGGRVQKLYCHVTSAVTDV